MRFEAGAVLPYLFCAMLAIAPGAARADPINEAFRAAQWASLSSAGKALHQLGLREATGDPELAAIVRSRQDLLSAVAIREAELSTVRDANTAVRLRGEIDSLNGEIAAIDTKLAAEFPRYAELANPAPVDIATVQAQLREDEALLFFLSTDSATFVWALDRDDSLWFESALSRDWLGAVVADLRADLDPHARTRGAVSLVEGMDRPRIAPFDRMNAWFLYTQLIEPAAAILGGKSHIFAVTDGPLSGLPLSVLVSQRPRGADTDPAAMRETAWLVRRFATTTLPTVASLSTIRADRGGAAVRRNPFAGIGAPVLGVEIAAEEPVPPPGSDFFRGMLSDVSAVRNLPSAGRNERDHQTRHDMRNSRCVEVCKAQQPRGNDRPQAEPEICPFFELMERNQREAGDDCDGCANNPGVPSSIRLSRIAEIPRTKRKTQADDDVDDIESRPIFEVLQHPILLIIRFVARQWIVPA